MSKEDTSEITIIYNSNEYYIKLFGKEFVQNNKNIF